MRRLGQALGEVVRSQAGEEMFVLVEEIRALVARHRADGADWAREELIERIGRLELSQAEDIVRAFAIFCDLVNLAEEQHRIRRLDTLERRGHPEPVAESVAAAVADLKRQGVDADEMARMLERLHVDLVFTAHPTEAKRRSVLSKLGRIGGILHELERHDPLPRLKEQLLESLGAEVTGLWITDYARTARPSVTDEVRTGLYYFDVTLWDVVPKIMRSLQRALADHYPSISSSGRFLLFGSWIGGDRDGNAFVTADITAETLRLHRGLAVERHRQELRKLEQSLSFSDQLLGVSAEVRELLKRVEGRGDAHIDYLRERYPREPYRLLAALLVAELGEASADEVSARLRGQGCGPLPSVRHPGDILEPLRALDRSLREAGAGSVADVELARVIRQIETFGLQSARLDIRQHSARHTQALDELLRRLGEHHDYAGLGAAERLTLLTRLLELPAPELPREELPESLQELFALFEVLACATALYGREVIGPYVISMTSGPEDVLTVLLLARWFGLSPGPEQEGEERLAIAPLFETRDDLRAASRIMNELFAHPAYRRHLEGHARCQTVMIGYSDSNKDAGFVPANWELYQAQEAVASACRDAGISLTIFHGRGGSIARGGGPAVRAILAQPPDSMDGRLRVTEQGEMISERFGNPVIARRYLEQVVHAVLMSSAPSHREAAHVSRPWRDALEELSRRGYAAYRGLVYDTPEFLVYWQQATPIQEIGQLHLGSRPSKRSAGEAFSDVRAIPWVFSWMQSRVTLPGWYGLGSALESVGADADGALLLVEMYRQWPFFNTLIDNAQLSLGKADMGIASLYSGLVRDRSLADRTFVAIRQEFERTCRWVLRITGQREILENEPALQRAIRRRTPYIDPLHLVQIELLRRLRALGDPQGDEGERLRRSVFHTIVGIASGLKNTG
ncbi:MAG: phosphoenolpyruvate carboxylase [bacterium]